MSESQTTPNDSQDTLQNILTEQEILKITGLKKSQLAACRAMRGLPFLRINKNCRLYLERDVVAWLKSQRMVVSG